MPHVRTTTDSPSPSAEAAQVEVTSDDRPSAAQNVFASLLTPNWALGMLLFACMFLPGYRGCRDQTIRVSETFREMEPTVDSVYGTYLITWPFFFGLVVAAGTLRLAAGRGTESVGLLWRGMTALIIVNTILLSLGLIKAADEHPSSHPSSLDALWIVIPSIVALALLPIAMRRAADRFAATSWVQLYLAVAAAVSVTFVTPGGLLAKALLIGGKIAVVSSVLLIFGTLVQMFDGRRALNRRRGESPLQLSLRQLLLMMLIGGIACAWILAVLIGRIDTAEDIVPAPEAATTRATARMNRHAPDLSPELRNGMKRYPAVD